jgi:Putative auto-transporter adhesin, head GIN domain
MKKLFVSLLLIAPFYDLLAQKIIQDINVEKRNVSSFHGVEVATGIKLILTEGSVEEVAVSASTTEYRDKIITEVKNGILQIHYETKFGALNRKRADKHLRAYVSYKSLDKLNVNTGANLEINGILSSASLDLQANTGGAIQGEINITSLKVNFNTGAKITLSGKADELDVDGDTGGKFEGENLKTINCSADASTGARISVTVQKELNARANTGGNIRYRGEGGIHEVKTHTGGSVSKI